MASVNKVILVGNLGADPETRYLPSGEAVANLSVATTESWKDKQSGERKDATEWHRVSFFGRTAEVCGQYLKKGSQVYIEGRIQTRKWQDKDGQDRYTTEIRGETMKMLGTRQGQGDPQGYGGDDRGGPQSYGAPQQPYNDAPSAPSRPAPAKKPSFDDMDDDIPF